MESMVDDTHDSRDGEREDEEEGGMKAREKQPFRGTFCWPRGLKKWHAREGEEREQPLPSQPACQHAEGTKPCRREFRLRLRDK